ncbi:DUF4126 domain-containing protein [Rhizobium anhuiense]|uniref:DUF4126 domain-containing protein n=1 Tax=Rhizobium anhuiense TaxID=1184720 RepID=UPI000BEAE5A0|nr:DUF4126 domain-containing protein [Rhizobium anhuiense]PDS59921.1 DUF4126 domain-containing protein [Rhizobium anhuiense]
MFILLALLMGVVAGLRSLIAPTAVAWAAFSGRFDLGPTPMAFMAFRVTPLVFSALALVELVVDKLPSTPSRKVPTGFGARIVLGGLSGASIGAAEGSLVGGLIAGLIGAVIGTFAGSTARAKMALAFGHDRPAALVEDAFAIVGALLIILVVR